MRPSSIVFFFFSFRERVRLRSRRMPCATRARGAGESRWREKTDALNIFFFAKTCHDLDFVVDTLFRHTRSVRRTDFDGNVFEFFLSGNGGRETKRSCRPTRRNYKILFLTSRFVPLIVIDVVFVFAFPPPPHTHTHNGLIFNIFFCTPNILLSLWVPLFVKLVFASLMIISIYYLVTDYFLNGQHGIGYCIVFDPNLICLLNIYQS